MPAAALDPFAGDPNTSTVADYVDSTVPDHFSVPLIAMSDIEMDDAPHDYTTRLALDWRPAAGDCAFRVEDDSMMPVYAPGEIVVASPHIAPLDGDDVVARIEDKTVLRRFRSRGRTAYDLVPVSENWATVTINADRKGLVLMTVVEHRWRRRR